MSLNYSRFEPIIDLEKIEKKRKDNQTRKNLIKEYVEKHDLIKLECDYLGMDSYYYDNKTKTMYRVCNIGNPKPKFKISDDKHILKLNNIIS